MPIILFINMNKCNIADKIIDEIGENPKDKSKLLGKIGWAIVICSIGFSVVAGAIVGKPIADYIKSQLVTKSE